MPLPDADEGGEMFHSRWFSLFNKEPESKRQTPWHNLCQYGPRLLTTAKGPKDPLTCAHQGHFFGIFYLKDIRQGL
jgi:hypothetical protein